jgi:hypothetical protein
MTSCWARNASAALRRPEPRWRLRETGHDETSDPHRWLSLPCFLFAAMPCAAPRCHHLDRPPCDAMRRRSAPRPRSGRRSLNSGATPATTRDGSAGDQEQRRPRAGLSRRPHPRGQPGANPQSPTPGCRLRCRPHLRDERVGERRQRSLAHANRGGGVPPSRAERLSIRHIFPA